MNISERIMETKNRQMRELAEPLKKNAILMMMNMAFITGLGFVFWMLAARFYNSESIGIASATISAAGLIAMIGALGFNVSLIRFLPGERRYSRIINTSLSLAGLFSLVLGAGFLLGILLGLWSSELGFLTGNIALAALFLAFVMFLTIKPLLNSIFLARRNASYHLFMDSFVFSPLKVILIPLLSFMAIGVWLSWGIAILVSASIGIFYFMPKLYKKYRFRFSVKIGHIRHMIHYSLGHYVVGIFGSLPGLLLPLVILELTASSETAYFSISWMMANFLFTVPMSVSTSLFAEASLNEAKFKMNMKKALAFSGLLLALGMAVLFIFSEDILTIGFGDEYADNSSTLLRILVISALPLCLNNMYVAIKRVEKKVKELLVMFGFIAFSTIVGGSIMIGQHGLHGIAYAWLISQTVVMVGSVIGIYRFFKR